MDIPRNMDLVNPESLRGCLALDHSWHGRVKPKGFVDHSIEVVDVCNLFVQDVS